MGTRTRGLVPIEVRPVTAPDGAPGVLLQLPDGYVLMRPEDARRVAANLLEVADEVATDIAAAFGELGQFLVGTAVFTGGVDAEGEVLTLPERQVGWLLEAVAKVRS